VVATAEVRAERPLLTSTVRHDGPPRPRRTSKRPGRPQDPCVHQELCVRTDPCRRSGTIGSGTIGSGTSYPTDDGASVPTEDLIRGGNPAGAQSWQALGADPSGHNGLLRPGHARFGHVAYSRQRVDSTVFPACNFISVIPTLLGKDLKRGT
jgi:hypothetical protein